MSQQDFFKAGPPPPPVVISGGFLDSPDDWMARLRDVIPWQQHRMPSGTPMPRQEVWFSETPATYSYSGETYRSEPMLPALRTLLGYVNVAARASAPPGWKANAVFANLYRDGSDSIGWHSDDERVLGPTHEVVIASLSIGARRRFKLRHNRTKHVCEWQLGEGDLLIMLASSQSEWVHCVPKMVPTPRQIARGAAVVGARINLTFRQVHHR